MQTVLERLQELQARSGDAFDAMERAGLYFLNISGVTHEDSVEVLSFAGKDKWAVWAADSMVWTARRLRAGEYREAMRGWGQIREYTGRNGGFLPAGLSDHVYAIQNALEARLRGDA